jgi:diguanylate cyclase (GGDEF)-like protein
VLSEAWAELLDRPPGETRTTVAELATLVHPTEVAELMRLQAATITGRNDAYSVEHRVRAASGQWKWILSRGQVVAREPATGKAQRMMGTNLDITARKEAELRMEYLASYDTLTGAANRALFGDRIARAILRNRRSGGRAALLYLDIDKFKGVNDSLGHAAGDELLKEFTARLGRCVRATDAVGRLGGDEFAVLLEDVTEAGAAERVAAKILDAMRVPFAIDGHGLTISASIGMVEFGADAADDPEALARRADAALYEAKAGGRDTYRIAA